MAFKEVQDLDAENVVSLGGQNKKTGKANLKQVEGYFLGSKVVPDKKKKSGEGFIHIFQTKDGNLGIWGKTDLDRKLANAPTGSMVRATHSGFRPTPNGDMYTYKVEVDEDNRIDVALMEPRATKQEDVGGEDTQAYESEEAVDDTGVDQDDVPMDEAPPAPRSAARPAPRAADPNRAKAVQDLLRGRSKR